MGQCFIVCRTKISIPVRKLAELQASFLLDNWLCIFFIILIIIHLAHLKFSYLLLTMFSTSYTIVINCDF